MMGARRVVAVSVAICSLVCPQALAARPRTHIPVAQSASSSRSDPATSSTSSRDSVGDRLATALNQPVIVENHAGAAGNVASEVVARAAPDGYTLLVSGVLITLLPLTYGTRAVDPVAAFAPISRLAQQPIVIALNASNKINTLTELIARARSEPGKLAYATTGVGTAQHVAMTMLSQRAGVEFFHVPYANSGQLLGDVLSGEVPIAMSFPGTVDPHVKSGRLRALAVTSAHRALMWPTCRRLPNRDSPDSTFNRGRGVLAPAGTPPEIISRLHREIVTILAMPDVRAAFLAQSAEPVGNTPAEFAAEIKASMARWAPVVKAAGIKVD